MRRSELSTRLPLGAVRRARKEEAGAGKADKVPSLAKPGEAPC